MCAAFWLLGFEIFCEVHKQRHINKLLNAYEKLKKKLEKRKTPIQPALDIRSGEQVTLGGVTVEKARTSPSVFVLWFGIIPAILNGFGIVLVICASLWGKISWDKTPTVAIIVCIIIFIGLLILVVNFLRSPVNIKQIVSETRHLWLAESGENGDKVNSGIMRRVVN